MENSGAAPGVGGGGRAAILAGGCLGLQWVWKGARMSTQPYLMEDKSICFRITSEVHISLMEEQYQFVCVLVIMETLGGWAIVGMSQLNCVEFTTT